VSGDVRLIPRHLALGVNTLTTHMRGYEIISNKL
jgi:hypothetical protein